jgi:acyl-coenzyme A synthetase/AMP-(fatty) acid ligase
VEKHQEFEKTYGIPIVQLAGGTETGFMCGNAPGQRKLGSIGRPTLNIRLRILDEAGRELPPGHEGEMVVSGRQLASAYWQGPEQLVSIPQDGFRNGDLARRDEDGFVYITGRKKDIIIKGGVNIASLEITNCLLEHPDVADAATLGVRDDIYGEVPVGFAAPRPGRSPAEVSLLEHCRARLVVFKVPAAIVVVDTVPKNANGKIDRETSCWRSPRRPRPPARSTRSGLATVSSPNPGSSRSCCSRPSPLAPGASGSAPAVSRPSRSATRSSWPPSGRRSIRSRMAG